MIRTIMNRILLLVCFYSAHLFAADVKLAQTGFQFLSVTTGGRASGMGEAMTTVSGSVNSLFYNPAGLASVQSFVGFSAYQNNWIADINYNSFSLSLSPAGGRYGVFGLSMLSVNYGEIQGTRVYENEQGFIDTDIFTPTAHAIGIGYARALSDQFSVGGHIKQATQNLGTSVIPDSDTTTATVTNEATAIAFDFGTIYKTGFKSLAFGMSIRNFSQEVTFQSEGFQLPLTFRMGFSFNLFDFIPIGSSFHSLLVTIDALHPRSYSERMNIGIEYELLEILSLRGGYLYNYDERNITAGVGVHKQIGRLLFGIDYAYTPFGVFDNVNRVTVKVGF